MEEVGGEEEAGRVQATVQTAARGLRKLIV